LGAEAAAGNHANILDTSEMMAVNPAHVRPKKFAPGGGYQNSGVSGDPTKSTAELGRIFIQIKVDNAVAQIKGLIDGSIQPAAEQAARGGGGGNNAGRGGGAAGAAAGGAAAAGGTG